MDYAQGAAYQFANDMSLGTVDRIATAFNLCMDCNRSDAYKQGEKLGRDASIVVASNEQVLGGATTASALAAGTSTAGPAIVCTVVTGGVCAVPSGGVIAVEAVAAATGGLIYANGSAVIAYAKSNSVSGNYKFPNANEIAKRLGVNENTFHRQIKPDILGDPEIAQLAKKIGATNPAIGIDKSGNIVLRNPNTGKTISTNIPLSSFGNQK